MKKNISVLALVLILLSSNVYSFSLFGSKIDGFWSPSMDLMMAQDQNKTNKQLNSPIFGKLFKKLFASIVLFINGEDARLFILGEQYTDKIIKTGEDKFKIRHLDIKYQKLDNGKETLTWVQNDIVVVLERAD